MMVSLKNLLAMPKPTVGVAVAAADGSQVTFQLSANPGSLTY